MRITLFICFMFSFTSIFSQNTQISPGVLWNDIDGEQINAHGGCVVYEKGTYYWFGEDRTGFKSNGVSCYQMVQRAFLTTPIKNDIRDYCLQNINLKKLIHSLDNSVIK